MEDELVNDIAESAINAMFQALEKLRLNFCCVANKKGEAKTLNRVATYINTYRYVYFRENHFGFYSIINNLKKIQ